MPQGVTAVVPTRPRLGFSIESLVGGSAEDKRRSVSPPCPKMPESPPTSVHDNSFFQRELMLAREQNIREQIMRDQLLRDHLTKEQVREHRSREILQSIVENHNRASPPRVSPNRTNSPPHFDEESPLGKKVSSTPPSSPITSLQNFPHLISGMPGLNLPPHLLSIASPGTPPHPLNSPLVPHPLLAQQQMQHLPGTPLPAVPGPREYPLYPWLMSRHAGRMMVPFPGENLKYFTNKIIFKK